MDHALLIYTVLRQANGDSPERMRRGTRPFRPEAEARGARRRRRLGLVRRVRNPATELYEALR